MNKHRKRKNLEFSKHRIWLTNNLFEITYYFDYLFHDDLM